MAIEQDDHIECDRRRTKHAPKERAEGLNQDGDDYLVDLPPKESPTKIGSQVNTNSGAAAASAS